MTFRHRWSDPVRFQYKSERTCLNGCGIVKVTHHESGEHWVDYWRGMERLGTIGRTPPCLDKIDARPSRATLDDEPLTAEEETDVAQLYFDKELPMEAIAIRFHRHVKTIRQIINRKREAVF